MKHLFIQKRAWGELINVKDDESKIGTYKLIFDATDIIYDRRIDPNIDEKSDEGTLVVSDNGEISEAMINGLYINGVQKEVDDLLKFFFYHFDHGKETLAYRILSVESNRETVLQLKKELRDRRGNQTKNNVDCFSEPGYVIKCALMCLWNYIIDQWNIDKYRNDLSNLERAYFYLTASNICRRLSQSYYTMNRDFAQAELWGEKAIEMIWHGYNCCKVCDADTQKHEFDFLTLLFKYNMGTHYLDYARRNRRSNNDSAENYFVEVVNKINGCYGSVDDDERRQYLLLYIEAYRHCVIVNQRRLKKNVAFRQARAYCSGVACQSQSTNRNAKYNSASDLKVTAEPRFNPEVVRALGYDCEDVTGKRIRLLAMLDYARCLLDRKEYAEAMDKALVAIDISKSMDNYDHINVDSLVIISYALRKLAKDAGDSDSEKAKQDLVLSKISDYQERLKAILFSELTYYADAGQLDCICELIKWQCRYLEKAWLRKNVRISIEENDERKPLSGFPTEEDIRSYLQGAEKNLTLSFYKGVLQYQKREFGEVISTFEGILARYATQTSYIRPDTIGLKVRYQLANAHMKLGHFSDAMSILCEVHDILGKVISLGQKHDPNDEKPYVDERIVVDLSYCYNHEGNYTESYRLFEEYARAIGLDLSDCQDINIIIHDNNANLFLKGLNGFQRRAGYNNLLRSCIFLSSYPSSFDQRDILDYTIKQMFDAESDTGDCERNLLYGYWYVLQGDPGNKAIEFFRKACMMSTGYVGRLSFENMDSDNDVGALINRVEYISAYIISLTSNTDGKSSPGAITEFIKHIPSGYRISLKAAISLAMWLLDSIGRIDDYMLCDLCRAFSYVTIYEERGAAAFNQLRDNPSFRLIRPEYRGYILARLLLLYEPINKIKEYSTFNLEDKEYADAHNMHLVHHTKLSNLKSMLTERGSTGDNGAVETCPRFRISNCGYVNDITEGRVFIGCERDMVERKARRTIIERYISIQDYQSVDKLISRYSRTARVLRGLCEVYGIQVNEFHPQTIDALHSRLSAVTEESEEDITVHINGAIQEMKNLYGILQEETVKLPSTSFDFMGRVYNKAGFELGKNAEYAADNQANRQYDVPKDIARDERDKFDSFCKKYFPQFERRFGAMNPTGSTVYTASLSVKNDSFPMWKIYADDENGCNIEFADRYFDIKGVPYWSEALMPYLPSPYTDADYPLYNVQYIGSRFREGLAFDDSASRGLFHRQNCGTRAIKYAFLRELLSDLYRYWKDLDDILPFEGTRRFDENRTETDGQSFLERCKDALAVNPEAQRAIIDFAADRINEVRFLFKDSDYEYEGEVRVVYNDNPNATKNMEDYIPRIPHEYIPIERPIKDLTVTLGSKINDMDVDKIVTWLYKTGYVRRVKLAKRNRYAVEIDPGRSE